MSIGRLPAGLRSYRKKKREQERKEHGQKRDGQTDGGEIGEGKSAAKERFGLKENREARPARRKSGEKECGAIAPDRGQQSGVFQRGAGLQKGREKGQGRRKKSNLADCGRNHRKKDHEGGDRQHGGPALDDAVGHQRQQGRRLFGRFRKERVGFFPAYFFEAGEIFPHFFFCPPAEIKTDRHRCRRLGEKERESGAKRAEKRGGRPEEKGRSGVVREGRGAKRLLFVQEPFLRQLCGGEGPHGKAAEEPGDERGERGSRQAEETGERADLSFFRKEPGKKEEAREHGEGKEGGNQFFPRELKGVAGRPGEGLGLQKKKEKEDEQKSDKRSASDAGERGAFRARMGFDRSVLCQRMNFITPE